MVLPAIPTIDALDVDNRRVFVRVDFNVPLSSDSKVRDDTRIRAALPTLKALLERGARLVVASHLGRPKGGKFSPEFSMEPVAEHLAGLLDLEVKLPADEVVGDGVTRLVNETRAGQIVLLQNLRFDAGEEKNSDKFSDALAALADAYVNDAFGASHRAHASVVGVPVRLPERAAGYLVHKELTALSRLVDAPESPFVAVVGGAKVSDKLSILLAVVERLSKGDAVIIGGAMANTFLAAGGLGVGASLHEGDRFSDVRSFLAKAEARGVTVLLPSDLRVGTSLKDTSAKIVGVTQDLAANELALDVGPDTVEAASALIASARTVFWNGPLGLFENPVFAEGTLGIARAVAAATGFTVVGGGDSVAALAESGLTDEIDHVSTGGGASLEFIEGQTLPGVAALLGQEIE